MSTLPPLDSLVQSLVDALSPVLSPLLSSLPLVDLFHHADKTLRAAVLDATREVTQRALSQPKRPEPGASKKTFQVHSALGLLTFVRWGTRDEQGCWQDPLPHAVSGRGCTAAVRQQIAWLHTLMTTQETCSTLRLFHAAQPSLATVHRVAGSEGPLQGSKQGARVVGREADAVADRARGSKARGGRTAAECGASDPERGEEGGGERGRVLRETSGNHGVRETVGGERGDRVGANGGGGKAADNGSAQASGSDVGSGGRGCGDAHAEPCGEPAV
jgi:hypothetical protein